MILFWENEQGKAPPPHARFICHPFRGAPFSLPSLKRISSLPPPCTPIRIIHKKYVPDRAGWENRVQEALQKIEKGNLQKIVLARTTTFTCAHPPDPFAILSHLKARSKNATLFCLQTPSFAFLGATPERLFSRRGQSLESDALAGTNEPFDEIKRHEFRLVQTFLHETLSPLCTTSSLSEIGVKQATHVRHLHSVFSGTLKEGVSNRELLTTLHPTPALCGLPREAAFQSIEQLEPFSRFLYGGVLGWETEDTAEMVVAIRCCLIQNCTVTLYAGAGLVAGSHPAREWEELNLKTSLFDGIFYES